MKKAFLALADGTVFEGKSVGATGTTIGELVFTTGMTGYLEALTDPNFAGQIALFTYPIVGNYGVNREDCLSDKVQVRGAIMKECAKEPNNFRSQETLEHFLVSENVIAITDVDTRALTRIIRDKGAMSAVITTDEDFTFAKYADELKNYAVGKQVESVTCKEAYTAGEGDLHVAVLDLGLRRDVLDGLTARGVKATVYPASAKAAEILAANPDGIMISGGPGNPADYAELLDEVKALLTAGKPFFAFGLGHQLAALSMGGKTEALQFGHRGANQPVKDLALDKTFMTVQNHGYAVVEGSLPSDVAEVSHINLNDKTVEGVRYKNLSAVTVQFHPESKPGPMNKGYVFDEFVAMIGGKANA